MLYDTKLVSLSQATFESAVELGGGWCPPAPYNLARSFPSVASRSLAGHNASGDLPSLQRILGQTAVVLMEIRAHQPLPSALKLLGQGVPPGPIGRLTLCGDHSEDSGADDQATENVLFTQAANTRGVPRPRRQNGRQRRDRSHRYVVADGLPVWHGGDLAEGEPMGYG
jgi:hypothetical protein